ncbi:MAG: class I poly(R)-hydroxyalkanoic acid synthase, partial [Castellaniella sp.]
DFTQAWQSLLDTFRQGALTPPADRRFSSEAWAGNPHALFSAHAYLLMADALQRLAQAADLEAGARERLKFSIMQWVEAAAPSNFLASNPDALKAMVDSGGESLQRGLANLMRDLTRGRITQTDESAFEPGENLAMTPGAVIYENALMQIIQYRPQTAKVRRLPLLMVPPCINKYYILDLQPANSLVLHAVRAGFE